MATKTAPAPLRQNHTDCQHANTKVARARCRRERAHDWEVINRDQLNGRLGHDVRVYTPDGTVTGTLLGWGTRALAVRNNDGVRVRVQRESIIQVEIKREVEQIDV